MTYYKKVRNKLSFFFLISQLTIWKNNCKGNKLRLHYRNRI